MDGTNPMVRLCVEDMQAEGDGKPDEAQDLYERAWAASKEDFDACMAAHYLARQQPSTEETLRWNKEALDRADTVGDERVRGFYPSLYLNVGKTHEDLGDPDEAGRYYECAAERVEDLPADGYGDLVRRGSADGLRRTRPSEAEGPPFLSST